MIITARRINLLQAWKIAGPPAPRTISELQRCGAWGPQTSILSAARRLYVADPLAISVVKTGLGMAIMFTPHGVHALGHIPTKD